jgi:hypothetical protein
MSAPNTPDVRIDEFVTEITVTEGVGPLSAQEVKRIAMLVLEQLRAEQGRAEQRKRDATIRDRAFMPGGMP